MFRDCYANFLEDSSAPDCTVIYTVSASDNVSSVACCFFFRGSPLHFPVIPSACLVHFTLSKTDETYLDLLYVLQIFPLQALSRGTSSTYTRRQTGECIVFLNSTRLTKWVGFFISRVFLSSLGRFFASFGSWKGSFRVWNLDRMRFLMGVFFLVDYGGLKCGMGFFWFHGRKHAGVNHALLGSIMRCRELGWSYFEAIWYT